MKNFQGIENNNPNSHTNIIDWLDNFGKQMSTRRSAQEGLQQQISILSKAYNNAQKKLLQTQKLLMHQSIFSDKQRSIIQLLKQILSDNIDDDTILTFMAQLERQYEDKPELQSQLMEIKHILDKNKMKKYSQKGLNQLKKSFYKVDTERKQLIEDIQKMVIENEQAQQKLQKLMQQIKQLKQDNIKKENQLKHFKQYKQQAQKKIKEYKAIENTFTEQICQTNLENKILQQKYDKMQEERESISHIITTFMDKYKQNDSTINIAPITPDHLSTMLDLYQKKLDKYKNKLRKLLQKNKNDSHKDRQLSLMKQFLTQQALNLFHQYQQQKQQCIEREILDLARLQRQQKMKLQECQDKMWKYKVRLLRQQQTILSNRLAYTQKGTISSLKNLQEIMDNKTQSIATFQI